MRRIITTAVLFALVAVAGGPAPREVHADGNGTASAPTGTIYFHDLSTFDAATNTLVLHSMDGEGGNVTPLLRTDRYVRPSRLLHGDVDPVRWFLTMRAVEGEEIGGKQRRDVFAVRADGAEVRVTSDPSVEYWMPDWVRETQTLAVVSMLGRRWTSDAPDATVVPLTAGLYLCRLDFDGGDVTQVRGASDPSGSPSGAAPRLVGFFFDASVGDEHGRSLDAFTPYNESLGGPVPDVAAYSWSQQGDVLLVQDLDVLRPGLRLMDSFGDATAFPLGEGQDPDFGRGSQRERAAFARFAPAAAHGVDTWRIETADALGAPGSARLTEVSLSDPATANAERTLSNPKYSPDGTYVAYQLQRIGTGTTHSIHRVTAGLGPRNLTPGVKPATEGESGMVLVAWR